MHVLLVQRSRRVYLPGLTKTHTSSRVSPFEIKFRHRRQRPRPVGAALILYVLGCSLNPLLLLPHLPTITPTHRDRRNNLLQAGRTRAPRPSRPYAFCGYQ